MSDPYPCFQEIALLFTSIPRILGCLALALAASVAAAGPRPVLLGLDGEFGLENSTSAQAIELGVRSAIVEINAAGGVLGGRPLELVVKDNRSIPARGVRNIEEFAQMPDLVAVFGGRFSPVVIEALPTLERTRTPLLAVWSSVDAVVENGMRPNYAFRLSLRDSLAIPKLLSTARKRGLHRVGLLLTNTSWGRSGAAAAQRYARRSPDLRIVHTAWSNWRDKSLLGQYQALRAAGAQAVLLIANDDEAAILVREVAALPRRERLPILSHWGISGGEFVSMTGPALHKVDLSVVQTFSFFQADKERLKRFLASAAKVSPVRRIEDIKGPAGVAHAYDMTHILARAIDLAGTTDRAAVRAALEAVPSHRGLIKRYAPPFTPARHEALGPGELLIARYREDGVLVPTCD